MKSTQSHKHNTRYKRQVSTATDTDTTKTTAASNVTPKITPKVPPRIRRKGTTTNPTKSKKLKPNKVSTATDTDTTKTTAASNVTPKVTPKVPPSTQRKCSTTNPTRSKKLKPNKEQDEVDDDDNASNKSSGSSGSSNSNSDSNSSDSNSSDSNSSDSNSSDSNSSNSNSNSDDSESEDHDIDIHSKWDEQKDKIIPLCQKKYTIENLQSLVSVLYETMHDLHKNGRIDNQSKRTWNQLLNWCVTCAVMCTISSKYYGTIDKPSPISAPVDAKKIGSWKEKVDMRKKKSKKKFYKRIDEILEQIDFPALPNSLVSSGKEEEARRMKGKIEIITSKMYVTL